jgi:hypothetical protein
VVFPLEYWITQHGKIKLASSTKYAKKNWTSKKHVLGSIQNQEKAIYFFSAKLPAATGFRGEKSAAVSLSELFISWELQFFPPLSFHPKSLWYLRLSVCTHCQ